VNKGIQTFLDEAGDAACYALDIIKIAELYLNSEMEPVEWLLKGIDKHFIYYNHDDPNDNQNFFVNDPAGFLTMMTDSPWSVQKTDANYIPQKDEYVVERWERVRTGTTIGHFRLPDWDSLFNSQTVKYGKIVSKRIFRRRHE